MSWGQVLGTGDTSPASRDGSSGATTETSAITAATFDETPRPRAAPPTSVSHEMAENQPVELLVIACVDQLVDGIVIERPAEPD